MSLDEHIVQHAEFAVSIGQWTSVCVQIAAVMQGAMWYLHRENKMHEIHTSTTNLCYQYCKLTHTFCCTGCAAAGLLCLCVLESNFSRIALCII